MESIPFAPTEDPTQALEKLFNNHSQNMMENIPLLKIDEDIISLEQAFNYLRASGELPRFLLEITRQYIVEQAIKQQSIEIPAQELVEQFMLEFRLQQDLKTLDSFHAWLADQGINYTQFRKKIEYLIQSDILKKKIVQPQLEDYFFQKKDDLTRIVLSRIVVETAELAEQIKLKLVEQNADFTQLAKDYSVVDDAIIGGVIGAVTHGDMPEVVYNATANVTPKQIIGPIQIENRYCLLKIEDVLIANLDDSLKRDLSNKLFDEWLKKRLQEVNIKLLAFKE